MNTPKEYKDNLSKGIITDEMVSDVAFTYDARAGYYLEREREALIRPSLGYSPSSFRRKIEDLQAKMARILKLWSQPTCIHVVYQKWIDTYFEDEEGYDENASDIVEMGMLPISNDNAKDFIAYQNIAHKRPSYFYCYEIAGRSFDVPISEKEATGYTGLKITIRPEREKGWWLYNTLPMHFADIILGIVEHREKQ